MEQLIKQGESLSLPKGWEEKKLDDVCELITCGVAARPIYVDIGIPFLSAKNVKNGKIIFEGYNCVSEKTHKELTKNNKPQIGDILYTRVGSYGEAAVIEENIEFSVFVSLTLIKTKKNILNSYFLKYYLNSNEVKNIAKSSITSSGVGNLNVGTVRLFPLPLPPLPEQLRIVSILDQTFAALSKAKESAQRNLQNAKELFHSYLQGVFEKKHEGWIEITLGEVCSLITDGKHGDCDNLENSGYYFLSAKDVRNDTLIFENSRQITKPGFEETHRRTDLKPGDICMVNTGATIGRMSLAPNDPKTFRTTFQKSVAVIKPIPSLINNIFCCYLLKADLNKLVKVSSGTAVPNLLLGDLKRHKINIPKSLTLQQTIVANLDSLSAETKRLEAIYQQKLLNLEELRKTVLQKAFNGQLSESGFSG